MCDDMLADMQLAVDHISWMSMEAILLVFALYTLYTYSIHSPYTLYTYRYTHTLSISLYYLYS